MNWFQRHLNWTVVLTYLAMPLVIFLIAWGVGTILEPRYGLSVSGAFAYSLFTIGLIVALCISMWILKQKGRNAIWVIPAYIIGVVAFFIVHHYFVFAWIFIAMLVIPRKQKSQSSH